MLPIFSIFAFVKCSALPLNLRLFCNIRKPRLTQNQEAAGQTPNPPRFLRSVDELQANPQAESLNQRQHLGSGPGIPGGVARGQHARRVSGGVFRGRQAGRSRPRRGVGT